MDLTIRRSITIAWVTSRLVRLDGARASRLLKEAGWILAGQTASVLGSLALVRVLTEFLRATQYGELALGLTVTGLIHQSGMGAIGGGISRYFVIAMENRDVNGFLRASWRLMKIASLCMCVIGAVLIMGLVVLGQNRWIALSAAAILLALVNGFNGALNGIQNAARQRQIVAFHSGLDSWLKIALAVGVMRVAGVSSAAVVVGYSLSSLLVTVSQVLFLRNFLRSHLAPSTTEASENWTRKIWLYSWPFSAWGVFTWAQQSSDRWSLGAFASTANVGLYSVVFQLGYSPISLATGLMLSFLGPILFQRSGDGSVAARNADVHHMSWMIAGIALAATIGAFIVALFLHRWIFALLVAASYRSASLWLPWMVLAGGLFAVGQLLSLKLLADLKPGKAIPLKIGTALLGITLSVGGAAQYGMPGVVGAAVIFSVAYSVWAAWLCRSCSPALAL